LLSCGGNIRAAGLGSMPFPVLAPAFQGDLAAT
jgi:hypothetical protein